MSIKAFIVIVLFYYLTELRQLKANPILNENNLNSDLNTSETRYYIGLSGHNKGYGRSYRYSGDNIGYGNSGYGYGGNGEYGRKIDESYVHNNGDNYGNGKDEYGRIGYGQNIGYVHNGYH